jgi:hypothetical protein
MNNTIKTLRVARSSGYAALLMICVRAMARYLIHRLKSIALDPITL